MYNIKLTTEEFIKRAKEVHGERYDYSLVDYKKSQTKIKIICHEHGIFEQRPNDHLSNKGCKQCGLKQKNKNKTLSLKQFIEKAKLIHGNKYDYSKTVYVHSKQKVIITCNKHGDFKQRPTRHLCGDGCPICNSSKGEIKIKFILDNYNINYNHQHKFIDCRNKKPLPFDFYLPEHNICIEFDGKQHFSNNYGWSSSKEKRNINFLNLKRNDKIKDEYCELNNIRLIRIPYWNYNNIIEFLSFLKPL